MVQEDPLLLHGTPDQVTRVAQRLADIGVDRVRITAGWSAIAPGARAQSKPDFDASDPEAYGDGWTPVDRAVQTVVDAGMRPMLDIAFWAPRWAVQRPIGGPDNYRWKPDPGEFAQFAEAAARRYDGDFEDLPAVRLWSTWNEPNHPTFLLPQWERREGELVPVSPHVYRELHNAGYDAIKAVDADNEVLIGNLSSRGDPAGVHRRMAPLLFVRELACVDEALEPLDRPECADFRPLQADGFAHHPYAYRQAPDQPSTDPDEVRLADLDRLSGLLGELHRRGRLAARLPLYLTEFGYESNPPAPRGLDLETQARWLSEATAIAYARDDVKMHSQFLLNDVEPKVLFQTGLLFADGSPKPALAAFRLAFFADGRAAFGLLRPGSGERDLTLERRTDDGSFEAQRTVRTNTDGEVRFELEGPGAYRLTRGADRSVVVEYR
jgi:hypothetical protein